MTKIKITGNRSLESKLSRIAYELDDDARRIRDDHSSDKAPLANSLTDIARQIHALRRTLES